MANGIMTRDVKKPPIPNGSPLPSALPSSSNGVSSVNVKISLTVSKRD